MTNRIASVALAALLVAAGLLAVAETVAALLGRAGLVLPLAAWQRAATDTDWAHLAVRAVAAAVAVVGVAMLVAQLRPWPPNRLSVVAAPGWHLHRRSVERRLAEAVEQVPGVTAAKAAVRGRAERWRVEVRAAGDRAARQEVERRVRDLLVGWEAPLHRLRVRLRRQGRVT